MAGHTIEVRNREGALVRVEDGQFLLDALEDAGLRLPFGCRFGACLSCAARLVEGEVDQSAGRACALRPGQKEEGYVLLCVARPRTDCVIDVGVRREMYVNQFRDGRRVVRPGWSRDRADARAQ